MKYVRHILTCAAVFGFACGVAVAALWVWTNSDPAHNFFESDAIVGSLRFAADARQFGIHYHSSETIITPPIDLPELSVPTPPVPRPYTERYHTVIPYPATDLGLSIRPVRSLSSIRYGLTSNEITYVTTHFFLAPYWVCIPMLLGFPLLILIRRRLSKAFREGLCPKCGYDLRAHAPGDKCPECGTPIPARA